MQYSPKLKKAMQEIKDILNKHDIAGFVVLHTPGFSEFMNKVDPSYSILKLENQRVQFNAHSKHFGGDKEKRDIAAAATKNMIGHFMDVSAKQFMRYHEIDKRIIEVYGKWDDTEGTGTSHEQQNN